jgi:hypothetical protein
MIVWILFSYPVCDVYNEVIDSGGGVVGVFSCQEKAEYYRDHVLVPSYGRSTWEYETLVQVLDDPD